MSGQNVIMRIDNKIFVDHHIHFFITQKNARM
jgi:hypothetical protein